MVPVPNDIDSPVLLRPDNFTPLSRTPWAGSKIAKSIKSEYVSDEELKIGEVWDFSCAKEFPSMLLRRDMSLEQLIELDPLRVLGPISGQLGSCEILVKIIDTSADLSVQVHPDDSDSSLKQNECGKPESWLILDAEPNAGIYLGFAKPYSLSELRQKLENGSGGDLLQFLPVEPGDYFEIPPGVPHAIGAGVTIAEPQRVVAGRSGKTFRMYDWQRLYDENGHLDLEKGSLRDLHIEESLRIIDPTKLWGDDCIAQLRKHSHTRQVGGMDITEYPANNWYQVIMIRSPEAQRIVLNNSDGFGALIMLDGQAVLGGPNGGMTKISKGMPVFVPNPAFPCIIEAGQTGLECLIIIPASCSLKFDAV
jgi:mannose-6-phosphate isomerase